MSIRLDLRQSQQLVMTPQLQQAIKLLQMSNLELTDYVAQEIERNPLLERAPPEGERSERDAIETPEPQAERPERLEAELSSDRLGRADETFDTGLENVYADESRADAQNDAASGEFSVDQSAWSTVGAGGSSRFDSGDVDLEGILSEEKTLREHLLDQLQMAQMRLDIRMIAADIIEQIDEAGYLRVELDDIATRLGAPIEDAEAALSLVQTFDPAGVAGRNLAECLALQLRERDRFDPAMAALVANLDLLAKGDAPKLLKLCGVDAEDLNEMIAEIRALDPKPGARFSHEIAQTLVPDVYVKLNAFGGWNVELNSDTLPRVLVNQRYAAEIGGRQKDGEVKTYISECLATANWLAKSLEQRARTILKVSAEIVRQQDGFLAYGVRELRPLNLKTVAESIGMHESTVSRVTSNKYIATDRGVFELKFFFTAAIAATDGGESHSAEAIRHRIKTMIDDEKQDSILSDDKIVQILRDDGVDIARRTVAKYRESMHIPSSVQRRRMKGAFA